MKTNNQSIIQTKYPLLFVNLTPIFFMQEKQRKLRVAQLLDSLTNGNNTQTLNALKELKEIGDVSVIETLVPYLLNPNNEIKKETAEIFCSLQQQEATDVIIDVLRKSDDVVLKQILLNTMWNSKLDYSNYLADIVSIALEGDFMLAIECLTLIENMSGPFEEHHLLESQLHLKEYLENERGKDDRKDLMVSDIASFIRDQNEGVDADLLLD